MGTRIRRICHNIDQISTSILPGNQPTAAALLDFGTQTGTSLTWTVNVTAGEQLYQLYLIHKRLQSAVSKALPLALTCVTALVPLPNPQPSQCRRTVSRCAAIQFLPSRSNANFESQHCLSHCFCQRNRPWDRYYQWCRSHHHQYYSCHYNVTGRPSHDSHHLQV